MGKSREEMGGMKSLSLRDFTRWPCYLSCLYKGLLAGKRDKGHLLIRILEGIIESLH